MNDIKAALQGTDWLMTQSAYDAMAARASDQNEFRSIRSERSGGTHTVYVHGPIVKSHNLMSILFGGISANEIISEIQENQDADEIVLDMDTPGGEAKAGIPTVDAVLASQVPIRTHASGHCASLGYMIAAATQSISAEKASLVGSIGAMGFHDPESEEYKVRSENAPEKDTLADKQQSLNGYEDQFYGVVTSGRNLSREQVKATKGMAFLGEEAKSRGLIDEIKTSAAPSASTNTQIEDIDMSGNKDGAITFQSAEELKAHDDQKELDARADERAKVLAEIEEKDRLAKEESDRVEAEATARKDEIDSWVAKNPRNDADVKAVIGDSQNFPSATAAIAALSMAPPAEQVESTFSKEINDNAPEVPQNEPDDPNAPPSGEPKFNAKDMAMTVAFELEAQGFTPEEALAEATARVSLAAPRVAE